VAAYIRFLLVSVRCTVRQ